MEKNFNNMTIEELEKLEELVSAEMTKRKEEKRIEARDKIYKLLDELKKICIDNNFILYYPNDYDGSIELCIDAMYLDD